MLRHSVPIKTFPFPLLSNSESIASWEAGLNAAVAFVPKRGNENNKYLLHILEWESNPHSITFTFALLVSYFNTFLNISLSLAKNSVCVFFRTKHEYFNTFKLIALYISYNILTDKLRIIIHIYIYFIEIVISIPHVYQDT